MKLHELEKRYEIFETIRSKKSVYKKLACAFLLFFIASIYVYIISYIICLYKYFSVSFCVSNTKAPACARQSGFC